MSRLGLWALVCLTALLPLNGAAREQTTRPLYELHMSLMEQEKSVLVHQQVTYVNDTGRPLRYVMFQLFANTMRRQATAPFAEEALAEAYPQGFAPGGVAFVSVQVNGEECEWGMQGESESFLRVACELAAGEQAQFQFSFYVLLPQAQGAFGVGQKTWRLNGFYPALCVFDDSTDDFEMNAMRPICDAYYAEMSDYVVTLELPKNYRVAGFGLPQNIDEQGGRISWRIEAQNVREIALVLSEYRRYERKAQDVTLQVFCESSLAANALLKTAEEALTLFSDWFGAYPYEALTITQCECLNPGDSASGLIQLNSSLFGWDKRGELKDELVRQLARQWFGGLVGSNPVREPWLQATLSEYARLLFVEKTQGRRAYLRQLNAQAIDSLRVTIPGGLTVDSPADRFTTGYEYKTVVLDRGVAVLHELRELMGAQDFETALRLYAVRHTGSLSSIGDFAAALDEASGKRLDEYLVGQLQTISDYAGNDVQPYE